MIIHKLKILPEYFEAILDGTKNFEIRKNDRNFKVGDIVKLRHWSKDSGFDGRSIFRQISFITDYHQKKDYVVFAMIPTVEYQAYASKIAPCRYCGGKGFIEPSAGDFENQSQVCCDTCDAVTCAYRKP